MKQFWGLLVFCVSAFGGIQAKIQQVDDLELFEEELKTLDRNSFLIFDLDYTIIVPKDTVMRPCCRKLRSKLLKEFKVEPGYQEYIFSIIYDQYEVELIDPKILDLIRYAKKQQIPTIAFTGSMTGQFGILESIEQWRYEQLQSFGIQFSPGFDLGDTPFYFDSFAIMKRYPSYYEGILFTDLVPKGAVLMSFLKKIDWIPKKVVFIDDRYDYLKSVESTLEPLGVEFIGFHYTAAPDGFEDDVSERVARFQYQTLIDERKWVSDISAKKILGIDL